MAEYDFTGLSWSSFERLVQSLAIKILGPGTTIFGDGPDGGREATYDGEMDFPSSAERWNGYCVLQAKFKQRPEKDDGGWALHNLEEELKKFANPKRELRKPDYYIFATNVVLSPVSKTGKKDKAEALFKKYAKKVPLRDHAIWDYDQLSRFLDGETEIRQRYAAWITSGDVLSEVFRSFKEVGLDFEDVLENFLAKEFSADLFARLTQAGQAADERIPLASVFVDLPVSDVRADEPPEENIEQQNAGFAGRIIEDAKNCFALKSGADVAAVSDSAPSHERKHAAGRYVLVGGPGQGKTTVSQLVCQLFRAAFLRDRDPYTFSNQVRDDLSKFLASCEENDLALPKVRRFPLRVALNEFAAELSRAEEGSRPSLLSYFALRIAKKTDREISPDDFRKWLATYPWILILDGLDEVPASSNRDEVLLAINDFWTDAAQCKADVLTIATTRPQGYNDDFSPKYYQHLWLTPLSTNRALIYADRLGHSKCANDDEERERIVGSLADAACHETTARLMRSPLQITIMFILIESGGIPPRDRWRLFDEYYKTIYRRERQRPIPSATLLRDHEKSIDIIHTRVALLLQLESERRGGSESTLPRDRFARIVSDHLAEEGIEGKELDNLTVKTVDAVEHRLVFLTGVQEGQIGFEIASLREFMAAQCLFEGEGTQEEVQARIEAIAPIAAWRNVFVFAAGRCFAEHKRRDGICTICNRLNNGDLGGPVAKEIRAGSLLAIDILEDGMARQAPTYSRLLASCALDALDLPPSSVHERLAGQWDKSTENVFIDQLESRLGMTRFSARLGAWKMLLSFVARDSAWAKEMAEENWPTDPDQEAQLFELSSGDTVSKWLSPRIESWGPRAAPYRILGMGFDSSISDDWLMPTRPGWWRLLQLSRAVNDLSARVRFPDTAGDSVLEFNITTLEESRIHIESILDKTQSYEHAGWLPLQEAAHFVSSPSRTTLVDWVESVLAAGALDDARKLDFVLPWPLVACVTVAKNNEDLKTIAQRARDGDIGDIDEWMAAESRWKEKGIVEKDLRHLTDRILPFDREIGEIGFVPYGPGMSVTLTSPGIESACCDLAAICETLPPSSRRAMIADLIMFALTRDSVDLSIVLPTISMATLSSFAVDKRNQRNLGRLIDACFGFYRGEPEFWDFLDIIVRSTSKRYLRPITLEHASVCIEHLCQHPERIGLWHLVAMCVMGEGHYEVCRRLKPVLAESSDPGFRQAAVIIRLAQGNLSEEEASMLAASTVQANAEGTNAIAAAVRFVSSHQLFDHATEHYLLELMSRAGDQPYHDIKRVIDVLRECFGRRRSELSQEQRWRELTLPASLLPLIVR